MAFVAVAVLAHCLSALPAGAQLANTGDQALQSHVEALAAASPARAEGQILAAPKVIAAIYAALGYRPIWSNPASLDALRTAIARSADEGLLPGDFHSEALEREAGTGLDSERDILMTDALLRLLYQLYFGKVSPNEIDPNWNLSRPVLSSDPVTIVSTAVKDGKIEELIEKARLKHRLYDALKAQLRRYRSLDAAGGWPLVADGEPLKPGAQDPRIAQLRHRLSVTGEHSGGVAPLPDVFDDGLVKALMIFQKNHGLDSDGRITRHRARPPVAAGR
jgi:murein L,D-transpeptidase YcbB/YkuD